MEAFGRKVTSTAGHLVGPLVDASAQSHYQNAMSDLHKQLRRPNLQRSVFSFARTTPTDLVRSKISTSEIQQRALAYLPDDLLNSIPENDNQYSLFQGFQATLPDASTDADKRSRRGRRISRGRKLLDEGDREGTDTPPSLAKIKRERQALATRLEMMGIRKNMTSAEIREIDNKIANLNAMRKIVLDRLASLEQEETMIEHDLLDVENRFDDATELYEETKRLAAQTADTTQEPLLESIAESDHGQDDTFMSESIYEKLPSISTPKTPKRHKPVKRKSMPILQKHFEPGSNIRELPAHTDMITALDFDVPFGTLVTSALDDTVRVWDMSLGRCMGFLEGHTASVRALQVEDNICATGSMDATVRLWDLSKARYEPHIGSDINKGNIDSEEEDDDSDDDEAAAAFDMPAGARQNTASMADCPLFTLEAHVDEVTAVHFKDTTLISGSADKTLRQWDLETGRCVQTLDVLWASAQAASTMNTTGAAGLGMYSGGTGRVNDASADFVGALQVFDAALACGTADGMVRLWDLRSGMVSRSLVGHTGPVTTLQFDDVHLVTGSLDRSIRVSSRLSSFM